VKDNVSKWDKGDLKDAVDDLRRQLKKATRKAEQTLFSNCEKSLVFSLRCSAPELSVGLLSKRAGSSGLAHDTLHTLRKKLQTNRENNCENSVESGTNVFAGRGFESSIDNFQSSSTSQRSEGQNYVQPDRTKRTSDNLGRDSRTQRTGSDDSGEIEIYLPDVIECTVCLEGDAFPMATPESVVANGIHWFFCSACHSRIEYRYRFVEKKETKVID